MPSADIACHSSDAARAVKTGRGQRMQAVRKSSAKSLPGIAYRGLDAGAFCQPFIGNPQ
jgi:hypothetical protein